ncbi:MULTISPECIES: hypothetical protein [unclassified Pseudoalteromonas]|uniref:hypothetical protein n=1 Tax=unclassified Pseudoalteromonas TaxID=194690 RepID=UPI0006941417|nr:MULTISPECIES: hypothetical protein [unclassified Pseudoalteromonas]
MTPSNNKQVRSLTFVSTIQSVLLASVIGYSIYDFQKSSYGEIDVERINIVGENGVNRVVLATPERAPNPVIDGKEIERSIKPAGLVFYDEDGNETGGLATASMKGTKADLMIFDYKNSEAIGFNKFENDKGDFSASFVILDRLDLDKDMFEHGSAGATRIAMSTKNKDAAFSLHDTKGKERIRFAVDKNDVATIQMLDANGKVTFSIPEMPK